MTKQKKKIISFIFVILLAINIAASNVQLCAMAQTSKTYVPVGSPFGIKVKCRGVIVTGYIIDDEFTMKNNPSIQADIKIGDVILKVNDKNIDQIQTLYDCINNSTGSPLILTLERNEKTIIVSVTPELTNSGKYKIGIHLKDSVTGIGTITYYCPEDKTFGGLGHGICDVNNGNLVKISGGDVYSVNINGIKKGISGQAGEIRGSFNGQPWGKIHANSSMGVFGRIDIDNMTSKEAYKLADKKEIKCGEAKIISTLDNNSPKEYSVIIEAVNFDKKYRNFLIKVTDPQLLQKSGGIIQGMSGSPIIQNGKLVGAVTHVLVNDPTRGYGIFIENMLETANQVAEEQAKKDAS